MNKNKYYVTSSLLTKGADTRVKVSIHYGESTAEVRTLAISKMSDLFGEGYTLNGFEALLLPVEASLANSEAFVVRQNDQNAKLTGLFFNLEKDGRPELESDLNNLIAKYYPD